MYSLRSTEVVPSFMLILMGLIDCATTVVGVMYFGAAELNPFLVGIVSTNILAFLTLKVSATFCIGGTYVVANRLLNKAADKTTKTFKYSSIFMKVTYAGLIIFLVIVVVNNVSILLA